MLLREAFLQFFAGEEDAALYSAEGKVHVFGYLIVFVACHVHGEGYAVFVGEFVDGGGDFVGAVGFFGRFETAVLAQVEVVKVVGGVDHGGIAYGTAVVVDEDIAHDGENPSFEVGVFGVFVFVVKRLQSCVLEKVVSVVAIGGEHVGEVEQIRLKAHQIGLKFCACHSDKFCSS